MRTRILVSALLLSLSFGVHAAAQTAAKQAVRDDEPTGGALSPVARNLAGTWRSAPDELALTSDFDQSVWGPKATSVRTVELVLRPGGEGTLTVTRKVLDAKRRAIAASTSIEEARIVVGEGQANGHGRVEHEVTVTASERRYPDDPGYKWPIDGLKVRVASFEDQSNTIEVRFETPEGKGSFWETLRRGAAAASRRAAR